MTLGSTMYYIAGTYVMANHDVELVTSKTTGKWLVQTLLVQQNLEKKYDRSKTATRTSEET